jgi:Rrf2 family protein
VCRNTYCKMSKIISLSEAASIGIHSMILITNAKDKINVAHIADITKSSRHHVAKVLQRLVKEGFLESNRGPSGGFQLKRPPEEISLLDIFVAIEGKIQESTCLSDNPLCPFDKCLMGNIISKLSNEFQEYLSNQKLSSYIKTTNIPELIAEYL